MTTRHNDAIRLVKNGLIVSCQADEGLPMSSPDILAAVAETVALARPAGIRASLPENIRAIKSVVPLPMIGIFKQVYPDSPVFITPTFREIKKVVAAGADIVALDATDRIRPGGVTLSELVREHHNRYDVPLMADISTLEEGLVAEELGFDLVGTTLSGYTDATRHRAASGSPDFDFLDALLSRLTLPVIMEGRIWQPGQAVEALNRGAHAVVVGSAITRPNLITERYVQAIETWHADSD
jgi:N-acylglucosamine-6-phosphate 2-epimerase